MAHSDELNELDRMHSQGVLSDAEHDQARASVLSRGDDPADGGPPSRPRRRGVPWIPIAMIVVALGGVALIVLALVGGGKGSAKPSIVVNGVVAVSQTSQSAYPTGPVDTTGPLHFGSGNYDVGKGCKAVGGYQDIKAGANVVIGDDKGKVLSTVALRDGVFNANADCVFGFVARVDKVASYTITVAQRTPVTFNQDEVHTPQLILGS